MYGAHRIARIVEPIRKKKSSDRTHSYDKRRFRGGIIIANLWKIKQRLS